MNLNVDAIVFDHARGLAPVSTVPLRYDAWQPVLLPEWQHGQRFPSVAAYVIDQLAAQASVLVRFVATPDVPHRVEVRALAEPLFASFPPPALLLGDLDTQVITLDTLGQSAWYSFAFGTTTLADGVDCATLQWRWQARTDSRSPWIDIDVTRHRVYTLLGLPGEPWQVFPPEPQNARLPRTDMLDLACLWARGARSRSEAASRITEAVNRLGDATLSYDAEVGAPHYTVFGGPRFLCDAFLDRLRGGFGAGPLVNCSDCATIVSTFTNLLGGELWQSKMGLVGAGFRLNPILAIGSQDWSTLHGGFSFHEVAWTGACREDDLVYDACASLDADSNPAAAPYVPLLPLGMRFGRPGDGGYRDRIALRADREECAPQPALRIRRAVTGMPLRRLPLSPVVKRSLAHRTGLSRQVPAKEDWRFEGFCWFGNELGPHWLPVSSATFDGDQPAPVGVSRPASTTPAWTRTIVSTWKPLSQPHGLLRIEAFETDSAQNARNSMLELAAEIEAPALHPWESAAEAGIALDNGALVMFTRGNLLLALRSAGLKAIDVRELAQQVDRWLVGAGSVEPWAGPDVVFGLAARPIWLRWRASAADTLTVRPRGGGATTRSQLAVVTPAHAKAWVTRSRVNTPSHPAPTSRRL